MISTDTTIDIVVIPALHDNYIWVIRCADKRSVFVVDPGDAEPVLNWLQVNRCALAGILITHHHADHVGGVPRLLEHACVPVYGPSQSSAECINHPLDEGQKVTCFGIDFDIFRVPGHTLDHIAYYASGESQRKPILFSGDTLFAGGCGRLFEGSAKQMYRSLQKLSALPDDTEVYCAHEYTLANLRFALAVEPHNPDLKQRWGDDSAARATDTPTVPSSLALEKRTNPFIRTAILSVANAATTRIDLTNPPEEAIFAALRKWKDQF